jgi:hypothetical protein
MSERGGDGAQKLSSPSQETPPDAWVLAMSDDDGATSVCCRVPPAVNGVPEGEKAVMIFDSREAAVYVRAKVGYPGAPQRVNPAQLARLLSDHLETGVRWAAAGGMRREEGTTFVPLEQLARELARWVAGQN